MEVKEFNNIELYKKAIQFEKIGNEGIRRAMDENRKRGIPIIYTINGKLVYELPDGQILTQKPDILKDNYI